MEPKASLAFNASSLQRHSKSQRSVLMSRDAFNLKTVVDNSDKGKDHPAHPMNAKTRRASLEPTRKIWFDADDIISSLSTGLNPRPPLQDERPSFVSNCNAQLFEADEALFPGTADLVSLAKKA